MPHTQTAAHEGTRKKGKIAAAIAEFQRQHVRLHGYECQPITVRGSWIWAAGNPWRCAALMEKAKRMGLRADAIADYNRHTGASK